MTDLESAIEPELFVDYRHGNPVVMTVNVRTAADPLQVASTVRAKLAAIDPTQALYQVKRLDTALSDSIAPRRMTLTLLAVFAGSALLLGVIGIYGVMAYSVAQRTQEIGVRMALGATRRAVLMMIMTQGMRLTAAGVAIGALSAAGASRVLTGLFVRHPADRRRLVRRRVCRRRSDGDRGVQPSGDSRFSGGSRRSAAM